MLSKQYGIEFIKTEESYTSIASFLDGDYLPSYGEKPNDWKPKSFRQASLTGKRTKRGLYRTASNWYINADANGAANAIRKVSITLGLDLSEVCGAKSKSPHRIRLWSVKWKNSTASRAKTLETLKIRQTNLLVDI
ncbi:hypothetical protein [Okeania sp. SIO2C9]|uniref:hypothetical protein n=1 Tax=Okeania sp. SIO2C9 TaxID=2607791 RepID=UPI0025FC0976|nr:hypothetical protein [Okeania sp. SIO2C9]